MKRSVGTVIMIIVQLVFFGAFIYCANAAHVRFPLRESAAREELQVYFSLKGTFWGLYVIALHAMAFPAYHIDHSRRWSGFVWLNVCSLIVFCLSLCMELLFDYAYFKPVSELIQFSVLLVSINLFYLFLVFINNTLALIGKQKTLRRQNRHNSNHL